MVTFPGTPRSSSSTVEEWIGNCRRNGLSYRDKAMIDKLMHGQIATLEKYLTDHHCFLYYNETHYILSSSRVVRRKPEV